MKIIDLPKGLPFHVQSRDSQFYKELKKIFNLSRITWYDPCCDEDTTEFPVRFNVTTGTLERYDKVTNAWIEATASNIQSLTTGLTAFATGGQASATALPSQFNEVTTAATAGDSVKLPAAVAGTVVIVKNEGATSIDVFPTTGDTINDGAANAAVKLPVGGTATFTAINATNWETDTQTQVASGVINAAGTMFAGFFPTTAAQAITGAGAINVTAYLSKFTSSGVAQALTIASGTQTGQRKKVSHVVDGGSGVLTGVFVSGTTITFTTVGEFADLIWDGTSWAVLELGNTATPGTPPVLA